MHKTVLKLVLSIFHDKNFAASIVTTEVILCKFVFCSFFASRRKAVKEQDAELYVAALQEVEKAIRKMRSSLLRMRGRLPCVILKA